MMREAIPSVKFGIWLFHSYSRLIGNKCGRALSAVLIADVC